MQISTRSILLCCIFVKQGGEDLRANQDLGRNLDDRAPDRDGRSDRRQDCFKVVQHYRLHWACFELLGEIGEVLTSNFNFRLAGTGPFPTPSNPRTVLSFPMPARATASAIWLMLKLNGLCDLSQAGKCNLVSFLCVSCHISTLSSKLFGTVLIFNGFQ